MARSFMAGITSIFSGGSGSGISGVNTLRLNDGVVDQRAEVANSASLDVTNISASVYFIVRSFTGTMTVLSKYQDGIERSWSMDINSISRRLQAGIYVGNTLYSAICNSTMTVDTWYQGAFTYDGNDLKVYLNAVLEDTNSLPSGNLDTSTSDVRIGARGDLSNEQPFIGDIALPIIYSADILQAGITELLSPKDPSLYTQANMVMGLPLNFGANPNESVDTSGNSNNATLVNSPTYTGIKLAIEQESGGAPVESDYNTMGFTGVGGEYINVPSGGDLLAGTGEWAVSFYHYRDSEVDRYEMFFSEYTGSPYVQIAWNVSQVNNRLTLYNNDGGTHVTVSSDPIESQWNHTIVQRTATDIEVWLNGSLVGSTAFVATIVTTGHALQIGGQSAGGSANLFGGVANYVIANRSFTSGEISTLFNDYKPYQLDDTVNIGFTSAFELALPLNDSFASPANDVSGNSRNGTPTGAGLLFDGELLTFTE